LQYITTKAYYDTEISPRVLYMLLVQSGTGKA